MKTIMLILTLIGFAIMAISALIGYFKGAKKSVIALCRTLVSLIISFAAVAIFCRAMPASELLSGIFSSLEAEIFTSEAICVMVGSIAYTFAAPFAFLLLFIIIDLIMRIPAALIRRALGNEEKIAIGSRIGGAAARLALTFTVIIVLLMPFSNIFCTFSDGIAKITETAKTQNIEINLNMPKLALLGKYELINDEGMLVASEADRMTDDLIGPVRSEFFMSASYSLPVRVLCNIMTGTSDASSGARNEVSQIFDVICSAVYFAESPADYGEEQKAAIDNIVAYISESELHSKAAADAVSHYAKEAIEEGKTPLGEGNMEIISFPLFEILANTTPQTVVNDFGTLRDIVFIMIDYGLPADVAMALENQTPEVLISAFANEDMLYDLLGQLYANGDFRHMIAPVLDFAFTTIMQTFDPEAERMHVANVSDTYTSEFLRKEAGIFSAVFTDGAAVMDIAPKLDAGSNASAVMLETDLSALGRFVDTARESELIGEGITELFLAILKSPSFDSLRSVADILVSHIEAGTASSIESLLSASQNFLKIADMCKNSEGKTDTAAMADVMRDINKTCDPETTVILKEMITESDLMDDMIFSSDKDDATADTASKALGVMVEQLATGEFTEEEYEQEAKAVDLLVTIIGAQTDEEINDLCSDKEETNEMVEIVATSKLASATMIEIAYEDGDPSKPMTSDALNLKDKLDEAGAENVRTECKSYYLETLSSGEDTTQIDINFKAFSAIFDLGITDDVLASWKAEVPAQ